MQIVLQGPIEKNTIDIAHSYLDCDFIDKVIISCWETDDYQGILDARVKIVKSPDVDNPGIYNRNRQIVSSRNGLKFVTSDVCAKMRTDQKIQKSSLYMMRDFFEKFSGTPLRFSDGSGPKGRIFVASLYLALPFHPRDHFFWGYTSDLKVLFDIPLCPLLPYPTQDDKQYVNHTRTEAYIASYYYARFDPEITHWINNPNEFLVDQSPNWKKVLEKYWNFGDGIFKPFPPVQMSWPKRKWSLYPYYIASPNGETWDESQWRFQ